MKLDFGKMFKSVLRLVCMVVCFMLTGLYVYAQDSTVQENISVTIAGQKIVKDGVVNSSLPQGVGFDQETNTLTLTDFSCDDSIVASGGTVTLVLSGENTITLNGSSDWVGIDASSLIITGDGVLNINGSGNSGYGIRCDSFQMLSGIVNIVADNEEAFYGISRWPSYDDGASAYEILGGEIRITGKSVLDANVGIDALQGDLTIKNATVSVTLGSGNGFGVVTGLRAGKENLYGGTLTLDNAVISCNVADGYSMYFYKLQDLGGSLYYIGEVEADTNVDISDAFIVNEKYSNRWECESRYLTVLPAPIEMSFEDVQSGDWFYGNVEYVFKKGIMTGLSESVFGSYEPLSRAQFALIIYRLEDSPAVTVENKFTDVADGSWYADAVIWANQAGITTGYANGTFGPMDNITREQIAVMMYRYANYKGDSLDGVASLEKFADSAQISPYATDAVSWAVGNGIISGQGNGTLLKPQDNALRVECAAIIQRFLEN